MRKLFLFLLLICLCAVAIAADISQEYKYQVLVKEKVNGIEYRDAIYYTPDQWADLKQADVNTEITKRTDNFRNALENPPAPVVITKEMLIAEKAEYQARIADLDTQIAAKGK